MKPSGNKNIFFQIIAYPLSLLYGAVIRVRNLLFDLNFLKQKEFPFPVISVGNITVGGTGKTPMVEYLAGLFKDQYKVGILSRGYGRQSSGFVMAQSGMGTSVLGDELFQIYGKFPDVFVAACADRNKGMKALDNAAGGLDMALLDDAYQHRYIARDVNILLIDYHRLLDEDELLPLGNLREPEHEKYRADVIVVTKCPLNISPLDQRLLRKRIAPRPYQAIFFTSFSYGALKPVFPHSIVFAPDFSGVENPPKVILVSGIANPEPFERTLQAMFPKNEVMRYADHYGYRAKDIAEIEKRLSKTETSFGMVITTEKDAVKIRELQSLISDPQSWFYVPVAFTFVSEGDKELFDQKILGYVQKNQRNNLLHRKRSPGI